MPEYIEREALLKEVESRIMWGQSYNAIYEAIQEAPAVYVVDVLCKDCKNCTLDAVWGRYWCDRGIGVIQVKSDDYCSYGVRRFSDATD